MNKRFVVSLMAVCTILLVGCTNQSADQLNTKEQVNRPKFDATANNWAPYEKTDEAVSEWGISDYVSKIDASKPDGMEKGDVIVTSHDDDLIIINHFYDASEEKVNYCYFMTVYNTVSNTSKCFKILINDELNNLLSTGFLRITSIDADDSGIYIFPAVWNNDWELANYYAVNIDYAGNVDKIIKFSNDIFLTEGIDLHDAVPPKAGILNNGGFFIIDQNEPVITCTTSDGTVAKTETLGGRSPRLLCKDTNGIPIIEYLTEGDNVGILALNDSFKKVYSGNAPLNQVGYIDEYGNCLFLNNESLNDWDIVSGKSVSLLDMSGYNAYDSIGLSKNTDNDLVLVSNNDSDVYLYKLSQDASIEKTEIRLLQLYEDDYTACCAAGYSRTHPGVEIKVEHLPEDQQFSINKLSEQIKKGSGPDLLVCNRRQLTTLADDCLVTRLDDVVDPTIESQIFNGALSYGTINGELYGVPYDTSLRTMLVSDHFIEGEHWTLDEFLNIWKHNKKINSGPHRLETLYFNAPSDTLLYDFLLQDPKCGNFINWDSMTCSFDSEQFCQLLEMCKDFGEKVDNDKMLTESEMVQEVSDYDSYGYSLEGGLSDYSAARSALGDEFRPLGFPSISNGNYISCYRLVAETTCCQNNEIIADFLNYMLSEDNQVLYSMNWVRKDIYQKHVIEHSEIADSPIVILDGYNYCEIGGREDGSSYLDEYIELMENATPLSFECEIQDIICEEASAFFEGAKTSEEVVKIIQSRVSLYLSEHSKEDN